MFFPEAGVRVWLYTQPTDMRKSYSGLAALVKNQLDEDPLSGQLFVFINRKGNQMKILYFDCSGYLYLGQATGTGYLPASMERSHQTIHRVDRLEAVTRRH